MLKEFTETNLCPKCGYYATNTSWCNDPAEDVNCTAGNVATHEGEKEALHVRCRCGWVTTMRVKD